MFLPKTRGMAALATLALLATFAPIARAQAPAASATAEALFAEGRKLASEGKYAEACPKFEGAQKVAPTPGTQLNLADCYEKAGRIASAWASFREAVSMSRAQGRADLVATAQRRASSLEPRLPKLAITVTATAQGLELTRDGVVIPREAWTTPVAIDPGEHVVEAKAPGKKTLRLTAQAPAEGATATLNVPDLEIDPAAPSSAAAQDSAGSTGSTGAPAGPGQTRPDVIPSAGWSTQKTVGLVVAGVGVVSLAVGGIFALTAMGQNSDSKAADKCDGNRCSLEGQAIRDAALQNGNLATGFGAGGLVLAGAGALIFLTAPSGASTSVGIQPTPSGVWLTGRFH